MSDLIDITSLRVYIIRMILSGSSYHEIAKKLGYKKEGKYVDTQKFKRELGIVADRGKYRRKMNYDKIARICNILGIDPVDVGL